MPELQYALPDYIIGSLTRYHVVLLIFFIWCVFISLNAGLHGSFLSNSRANQLDYKALFFLILGLRIFFSKY